MILQIKLLVNVLSDSRMALCECLSICVGSKVHSRLHCVPQHLLFPLWSFFNSSLCCHCDILYLQKPIWILMHEERQKMCG